MSGRPKALVTGASRGIGRACSVALAAKGFDVAIAARSVHDGARFEHSLRVSETDTSPLSGSLDTTAALVREAGGDPLIVPMDLSSPPSVERAMDAVLREFGRVDVVVNNARYVGPGDADRFMETPVEVVAAHFQCNVLAPIAILQRLISTTGDAGPLRIIQISSSTGQRDPDRPVREGGWSMSYSLSKAAFHRIAGILVAEHSPARLLAFNVLPGFTLTERMAYDLDTLGFTGDEPWNPPEVTADVVAWLASDPAAPELNGQTIEARVFYAAQLASE